jgi:hypothetical protein
MATVFGELGDEFYKAFSEPDGAKRRIGLEAWADKAATVISKEIRAE